MKGHVTQYMGDIWHRLDNAPALALFLDFDGTLAPTVSHPNEACLDALTQKRLLALSTCPDVLLAIISGREILDLRGRVNLPDIVYAGNHGLEISGPHCAYVEPGALEHRGDLKELAESLAKRLAGIRGAWVEDKGLTASVHFRNVAEESVEETRRLVHATLANCSHPFQLTPGDHVFDIRPRVYWNKGQAVSWIRAQAAAPGALALYIGDDVSDEDAFAVLADDITIKVGASPETVAHYQLHDTDEVQEFLGWLATSMERRAISSRGQADECARYSLVQGRRFL